MTASPHKGYVVLEGALEKAAVFTVHHIRRYTRLPMLMIHVAVGAVHLKVRPRIIDDGFFGFLHLKVESPLRCSVGSQSVRIKI